MSNLEQKIREFILDELKHKLNALDIPPESIDETFNFVDSGALDSMGFIELIGAVENEFNFELDFVNFAPSEFTNLNFFVERAVESQASP